MAELKIDSGSLTGKVGPGTVFAFHRKRKTITMMELSGRVVRWGCDESAEFDLEMPVDMVTDPEQFFGWLACAIATTHGLVVNRVEIWPHGPAFKLEEWPPSLKL